MALGLIGHVPDRSLLFYCSSTFNDAHLCCRGCCAAEFYKWRWKVASYFPIGVTEVEVFKIQSLLADSGVTLKIKVNVRVKMELLWRNIGRSRREGDERRANR